MKQAKNDTQNENKFKIKVTKNGPYLASGGIPLSEQSIYVDNDDQCHGWQEGKKYPAEESYALSVADIHRINHFVMAVMLESSLMALRLLTIKQYGTSFYNKRTRSEIDRCPRTMRWTRFCTVPGVLGNSHNNPVILKLDRQLLKKHAIVHPAGWWPGRRMAKLLNQISNHRSVLWKILKLRRWDPSGCGVVSRLNQQMVNLTKPVIESPCVAVGKAPINHFAMVVI